MYLAYIVNTEPLYISPPLSDKAKPLYWLRECDILTHKQTVYYEWKNLKMLKTALGFV